MEFAREWNFNVITSSPHYPQSNGMAERTIQTVKTLLTKARMENRDPYVAVLYYRNSPVSGITLSPAQMRISRALKTKLPAMASQLMPEINHPREVLLARQTKQKLYYDRYTKRQPSFSAGEAVRIKHPCERLWQPAVVISDHVSPRSHIVETSEGAIYRHTSQHIRKSPSWQTRAMWRQGKIKHHHQLML